MDFLHCESKANLNSEFAQMASAPADATAAAPVAMQMVRAISEWVRLIAASIL
ncbi:hypothetical protein BIFDEN_02141 [Bifidobacterium dentium ATCC 27678]|nr:hypothetical protein BIFDEN_02141 [Bifidobacterium dentium ATCC 27678]